MKMKKNLKAETVQSIKGFVDIDFTEIQRKRKVKKIAELL